jgi:thiamine kinase-like enzyme
MAAELHRHSEWLQGYIAAREAVSSQQSAAEGGDRAVGRRFGLQTVLCHNDLLSGNILRRNESGAEEYPDRQVFLIDYEYAAYNYRAFDIANHISGERSLSIHTVLSTASFNSLPRSNGALEHCGFEYDYKHTLPSDEFILAFLRAYLQAVGARTGGAAEESEEFLLGLLVGWVVICAAVIG